MIVAEIVRHHIEEAAFLYSARAALCEAPNITLALLARHDALLEAHLDGMITAGDAALPLCDDVAAGFPGAGVFPAAVSAIRRKDVDRLRRVARAAQEQPAAFAALIAALEWLGREHLPGTVVNFLRADDSLMASAGIDACVRHGVDPGLESFVEDRRAIVRARALRAAGELGRVDLAATCNAAVGDPDSECQFWGAWSAVLLGNRGRALDTLASIGLSSAAQRATAFRLALQASPMQRGHAMLERLAQDSMPVRLVIEGSGLVGDIGYAPWLLSQMTSPKLARVAGEAFATIAGLDLFQGFEVSAPAEVEGNPTEDPEDVTVDLDPDQDAPWPDVHKIEVWWTENVNRFQPGTRCFMGAPVDRVRCIEVLKKGHQRRRILAAHYLCVLEPGTPLFNTSAPAWRQQRRLAEMT